MAARPPTMPNAQKSAIRRRRYCSFARAGDGCEDEDLPAADSDVGDRLGGSVPSRTDSSSVSRGSLYGTGAGVWLAAGVARSSLNGPPEGGMTHSVGPLTAKGA